MSPRRQRQGVLAVLSAFAIVLAVTVAPERAAFAAEKKAALSRFIPKWFKTRGRQETAAPAATRELRAKPPVEEHRQQRALVPRGGVEYETAIDAVTAEAKQRYAGRVPHDVIERVAREAVDEIWHPEGIAITNFVSLLAQRRVADRMQQLGAGAK